ncbi:2-hydroxyglutaryl-CoA dehydratase, partial [Clostridium botulinum]|nr:2-hydroxyglutaryl-CoA dehydratase [Clostridium botulinum]
SRESIIRGLCDALVRNYLNNVGKGKEILPKIFFQGGVAANKGIKDSFERALGYQIIVPKHHKIMGSIGAAIIAKNKLEKSNSTTNFRGFNIYNNEFISKTFECNGCGNCCEIVKLFDNNIALGAFGDRCGKWSSTLEYKKTSF